MNNKQSQYLKQWKLSSEKKRASSPREQTKTELRIADYTSDNLNDADLESIVTRVGTKIENIYDLTPGQRWMLKASSKVTSEFFLQFLFKAVIPLKSYALRQKLDEVCSKRDNLRSVYLSKGLSCPYRVVLKDRQAELRFEDMSEINAEELDEKLNNIMDADRRRGFDLERDPLLRVAVYKTYGKDSYAILISQPHINTDGMSVMLLIKDIFIDYAKEALDLDSQIEKHLPKVSYDAYAKWISSKDREGELTYWKELLKDFSTVTKVPGILWEPNGTPEISQAGVIFSHEIQMGLKEKQTDFGATLNSLMLAAWSILLMKMYHRQDVSFGAITSGRDVAVQDSMLMTGGFINALPVRAHATDDETVDSLVKRLQKQFMQSLTYAHCSPDEIMEAVGRNTPLFDHLLNFHNFSFAMPSGSLGAGKAIPGIQLIESKLYDNLATDLTIYFQNRKEGLGCNFAYNRKRFTDVRIKVLMEHFEHVIRQIAQGDGNITIADISCPDIHVFDSVSRDEIERINEIIAFMEGLDVFEGFSHKEFETLAKASHISEYQTDDIIIRERRAVHDLIFVMEGSVEICRKSSDGWVHSMMLVSAGKMLSASGIWDDEHSYFEARAFHKTKALFIPGSVFRGMIKQNASASINIMKKLNERAGAYSILWINQGR